METRQQERVEAAAKRLSCPKAFEVLHTADGDYVCVARAVEEEHGKIAVAQLPAVGALVRAHGAADVRVSALAYEYIEDTAYVRRLLGEQFGVVDCILLVAHPAGQMVYIEVEAGDTFEYVPVEYDAFEAIIAQATEHDRAVLFDNMNDDQTYVQPYLQAHLTQEPAPL